MTVRAGLTIMNVGFEFRVRFRVTHHVTKPHLQIGVQSAVADSKHIVSPLLSDPQRRKAPIVMTGAGISLFPFPSCKLWHLTYRQVAGGSTGLSLATFFMVEVNLPFKCNTSRQK